MRFLILAALVAVAAADYHDETFHFSTLGSSSGLKKTSFQSSQPLLAKKTITKTFQTGPLISSFAPQTTFLTAQQPILSKKVITNTYQTAPQISFAAQPPVDERFILKTVAQPVFVQQVTQQPAFERKVIVKEIAQPAFENRFNVNVQTISAPTPAPVAIPAFRQQTYAPEYQGPKWRILSQVQEVDPSGPYKYSYATENGIQVNEEGTLIPSSSAEGPVIAAQGSYSFTGDDGVAYSVSYTADENGFRAVGDHLPTPPPIPAEILKSLQENAASGEQYDDEGRLLQK